MVNPVQTNNHIEGNFEDVTQMDLPPRVYQADQSMVMLPVSSPEREIEAIIKPDEFRCLKPFNPGKLQESHSYKRLFFLE